MKPKLAVVAVLLLGVAAAQEMPLISGTEERPQAPNFIRFELLSVGLGPSIGGGRGNARLLYLGGESYWVRVGLGLAEIDAYASLMPIIVGFTVLERPVPYWGSLQGMSPEVYVEATGRFLNRDLSDYAGPFGADGPDFLGTLKLVGSVDSYGVGASLAVGVGSPGAFAEIRVHLLLAHFRL